MLMLSQPQVEALELALGEALGSLYVQKYFNPEAKKCAIDLVLLVRSYSNPNANPNSNSNPNPIPNP
jgi:hypothetical protein